MKFGVSFTQNKTALALDIAAGSQPFRCAKSWGPVCYLSGRILGVHLGEPASLKNHCVVLQGNRAWEPTI